MTMEQRTVWAQLFVFPIAAAIYFSIVLTRAASAPVDEISWVVPLVWTMGAIIVGIIIGTIAGAIAEHVVAEAHGVEVEMEDGDIRDKEIEQYGDYRARHFAAFGGLAVIILAMLEVDHFWIANAMFLAGVLGGIYSCIIRLRAYRTGF